MYNYCLFCEQKMAPDFSWKQLFVPLRSALLCQWCKDQLRPITGRICKVCCRSLETFTIARENDTCYDCIRWEKHKQWQGMIDKNVSLYEYNNFLKEFFARFKYRGDYVLAKAFSLEVNQLIRSLDFDIAVPIPLSKERLYERGFNQAKAIATEARIVTTDLLSRTHTEKQAKKSRMERIKLRQVFKAKTVEKLTGKTILLIDDIYTTGSTVRHAARALKEVGAHRVLSFTLARG